ncbi:hypothetical protein [Actinophytocola gossypii]|uniref:Uncharacterized protein n=1 Tax=Actinophytocola gossypii TaxID=2812003 RepID=A0ABT2J3J9_9PSEU|nr:hypothetical protein [Actinophytocola gossypii]MCT2582422.1 hypothetical protein [Actinophytocola gossypii]
MDPLVSVLVLAALLVAVVFALRRRPRPAPAPARTCVFCHRPIAGADHIAALKENAVRDLQGRVPADHPPATDPLGNLRWLAHVDCASEAGADLRTAGKVTGDGPPPVSEDPMERVCPACGHRFRRPDVVISTEDWARRHGPSAEQCPRCHHIWDTGDPPRYTIRG